MILREFEYSEFDGQQNFWALKDLTLEKVNLLVGKNATGKTNTITKITWLGNMLAGLSLDFLNSGNFHAEFADANDVYEYYLNVSFRNVILEKLIINGEEKLVRSQDGTGEIYADELKRKIKFQLPSNQLVAVSRRDTIQHPYLKNYQIGSMACECMLLALRLEKIVVFLQSVLISWLLIQETLIRLRVYTPKENKNSIWNLKNALWQT
jgi:hypothetical protein